MYTVELLKQLQAGAKRFDYNDILIRCEEARSEYEKQPSLIKRLQVYNTETLQELMSSDGVMSDAEIDDGLVSRMDKDIAEYLDAYLSDNEDYRVLVRIVSLYLTFIAKKPLHPPGLFDKYGNYTMCGGKVVCPIKVNEEKKDGSLCKYCCAVSEVSEVI